MMAHMRSRRRDEEEEAHVEMIILSSKFRAHEHADERCSGPAHTTSPHPNPSSEALSFLLFGASFTLVQLPSLRAGHLPLVLTQVARPGSSERGSAERFAGAGSEQRLWLCKSVGPWLNIGSSVWTLDGLQETKGTPSSFGGQMA